MSASVSVPRVGVRLIDAHGSVATAVVAGGTALTRGLHPPRGPVTETPPFTDNELPGLASLDLGGHDTVDCPLSERAEARAADGVLPHDLTAAVNAEPALAEGKIRPGGRRKPRTGVVNARRKPRTGMVNARRKPRTGLVNAGRSGEQR